MEKPSLKKIAQNSKDFNEFAQKRVLIDKFFDSEPEPRIREYQPRTTRQKKNLRDLANQSMTFSDFHDRTTENEKHEPIYFHRQNEPQKSSLKKIASEALSFTDYINRKAQEE